MEMSSNQSASSSKWSVDKDAKIAAGEEENSGKQLHPFHSSPKDLGIVLAISVQKHC